MNNKQEKLTAYEATGLSPDDVDQIRRAAMTMMFPSVSDFVRYSIQNFEQLEQYRKDEREGRIIRLPCKVGDMVYYKRGRDILGDTVDRISIDEADNQVILNAHKTFSFCDFGRKVFTSYEEAAAKLS